MKVRTIKKIMDKKLISIRVNEKQISILDNTPLIEIHEKIKPDADVFIVNGGVVSKDYKLSQNDLVVLIKRGEIPGPDELEKLMVARHTPGVHDKIKTAVVGIAGIGGLGSNVAISLARLGVNRLIIADFDVVEPSNLNRQQYFTDQIGMYKVDALKDSLKRINPYISVESHCIKLDEKNIPEVFNQVSVLVEAFDSPDAKAMIAKVFLNKFKHKTIILGSGMAGYYESNLIKTQRISDNMVIVGDLTNAAKPGSGLMAPRVAIAANHQANAVLRILIGEQI